MTVKQKLKSTFVYGFLAHNYNRSKKVLRLAKRGRGQYLVNKLWRKSKSLFLQVVQTTDSSFLYHRDNGEVLPETSPSWPGPPQNSETGFQESNRFRYNVLEKLGLSEKTQLFQIISKQNQKFQKKSPQAIVLHLYYPEMFFKDIHPYIENLGRPLDLFITINGDISAEYVKEITERYPHSYFMIVPNVGRDILPFLKIFSEIFKRDYAWVCKIHTKKSLHSPDGDLWREHIFSSLLSGQILSDLEKLPSNVGIVSPALSLLDVDIFIGKNEDPLRDLEKFYDLPPMHLEREKFIMGTMFWFRPKALALLESRSLQELSSFFDESSAIDGTYAHAYERLFTYLAKNSSFESVEAKT